MTGAGLFNYFLTDNRIIFEKTRPREKRECDFTIGSTPVAVGPGKYDLEVKRKKRGFDLFEDNNLIL